MQDELFDGKDLGFLSFIIILIVSATLSAVIDKYGVNDRGRLMFAIIFIINVSLYQSQKMLYLTTTKIFFSIFIFLNIIVLFTPFSYDKNTNILVCLPFSVLDYSIYMYGLSFLINRFRI